MTRITNLDRYRALKCIENDTAALNALTKRTREAIRLLRADTDARRARLDAQRTEPGSA